MLYKENKNKLGFTLVELLVVIAIIGIVSTATVVNLNQAKAKARDAKRFSDVSQIRKALEIYYNIEDRYPNIGCHNLSALTTCSSMASPGNWISELSINLADDPINTSQVALDNYTVNAFSYIFTRDGNRSLDYSNYYYILFRLETGDQIDQCNSNPWGTSWSCMGGGRIP